MGEEAADAAPPSPSAAPPPPPPPTPPPQERLSLAKVMDPLLEKIVKIFGFWRKSSKLVQECRAAQECLAAPPPLISATEVAGLKISAFESPLFDGPRCYSANDAEIILQPLVTFCDCQSAKIAEPALDCIQKLVAHGYLRGEVDAESGSEYLVLVQLMDAVCKAQELADENTELLVLKTLLTAVTSTTLRVHGDCLLKAVRTCFNIFLGSKSVVNQTTAKASLTQMLVIIFRRMEADSSTVPVQPIVVADLMEPAATDNNAQFVQTFITKVVQDIEGALNPAPSLKSISMKHDGAFEATATENSNPHDFLEASDRDMLDAKYWEVSMYKNALDGRKAEFGEAESDRDGDVDVDITNKLRRDAFLVFRALCKLSVKSTPADDSDPLSMRGKGLALELLKLLLENAGSVFRTSERFLEAIKQYLCMSLLKNGAIPVVNIFQLSCSILMSLLSRFRAGMKTEIGVFFPMIVVKVLENVAHPNYQHKVIVIRFLEKLCVDPQILVDVFVNYDCDVDSSNIFERLIYGLLKTAQGVPPGVETSLTPVQDATLKLAAMKSLVGVLKSMGDWANKQLRLSDASYLRNSEPSESSSDAYQGTEENGDAVESRNSEGSAETSEIAAFEQRRAYKMEFQEGVSLFNRKPAKGLQFLINAKKIGDSPKDIASFLLSNPGLDKVIIGDYLGGNDELPLKVMHAYVDSFNFEGMEFDDAIRAFLQGFRLPGEAQKIDRLMEKFAERYCKCNPKAFTSADTAYVLAYSVIMLNTDAHSPMVKFKMTKAEFIKNNRGIDDGNDLAEEFMSSLYDRIVKNEIKMKADNAMPANKPAANRILGIESILNIVIRKPKEDKSFETSDDIIRHMQQQLKAKAGKSKSVYYSPTDVEILRPMIEVTWAPMLAAFSVPLEKSEDQVITLQCLEGLRYAIHVTSVMCMRTERDAFVTSLAKFTYLHSPADIKQKNIDAIKAVISVADEDGNYLREAWEHILTCVSRFEHLHLIGEGAPPDATFFAAPQNESEKASTKPGTLPVLRRKGAGRIQYAATVARRGSYESAGVGGNAANAVTAEQMSNLVSNLNMLEQIGSFEINKIFTRSDRLNGEALVEFVKALCKVSLEELRSPTDPRVFSLTKIVEISHFNMTRIRLVWSRMWNVLAEYFVTVGCSDNLSIAMYAMDSLRQLAMKFLEREELANYNFQNQFMKPFVVVMRKSSSVEIRELVIRCVSQMVFARVGHVKSGWKIMFMVFTTAATDEHKSIVLLAFETIEKIVREYFPYITETETTTFTDCVNCLIAFTNSRFNSDVSLNAIAFLRFCAHKLAEGELGASARTEKSTANGDVSEHSEQPTFTDRDDHLHFWFPLLAGLSELTFDPRPEIRKSALEVLFDILRSHGHMFSPALWERVFDSVLLPLFDYVRRAIEPGKEDEAESEMDAWLYESCTLALQLVVDLFVKFYPVVAHLLGRILLLLTGFLKRPHQNLAAIGVAAFVRLMGNTGHLFSEEKWQEVLTALREAAQGTLPDVTRIAECYEDLELQRAASYGSRVLGDEDPAAEESQKLQAAVSDFKCRTAVQLLLVQAINEMYTNHGNRLSAAHTMLLLNTLHQIATYSHDSNRNQQLRSKLNQSRSSTQLSDPPLLRLEIESYHAYLNLLQMLPVTKPDLAKAPEVESRLVELCEEVLQVYLSTAGQQDEQESTLWSIPLSSSRRRELAARAPLVVSTLQAISGLRDAAFEKYLVRYFPLLAKLIGCEHGSQDVQVALSDMFSSWIGPLLLQACC